jgi:hypothetical protein
MNRDMSAVVGWRTSSYSANGGGQCVEVGSHIGGCGDRFAVRDSTQRDLGYLSFPSAEWATFLSALG